MKKFWMCCGIEKTNENGQSIQRVEAPTKRHPSKNEAIQEAQRIARKCPTKKIVVLEAIDIYFIEEPPVVSQGFES